MNKISCPVIRDLLPLYVDEVVSKDTKNMVEAHLQHCEACRREYDMMKRDVVIPTENKASILKKMNKKWRNKKFMISFASVFATLVILFGVFVYVAYHEKVVPYSKGLIEINKQDDKKITWLYHGKSYSGVNEMLPVSIEINGEKKNVSFIYFTETIAESPKRDLFNIAKDAKQNYKGTFSESEKIDAIYYVKFDWEEKDMSNKSSESFWESLVKKGTLIWERK